MFNTGVMMLRLGLAMAAEANALETAISKALGDGVRTRDLGGSASTEEATQAVLHNL
jgi:3-isopropylmalate dehydrogenase